MNRNLWKENINSWFSPLASVNVKNNCTMYNNVKHVRMSNAKIKGLYLIDFLINHLYNHGEKQFFFNFHFFLNINIHG